MKDRIRTFITDRNLTATQFADEIGVQRSSISHILSGRNHPGYEFIQKVLKKYPSVNAEWLLLGKGQMYKEAGEQSLFTNVTNSKTTQQENIPDEPSDQSIKSEDPPVYGDKASSAVKDIPGNVGDKRVERVLIFYNDHTFDAYFPNK